VLLRNSAAERCETFASLKTRIPWTLWELHDIYGSKAIWQPAGWLNGSKGPTLPLTNFQTRILRLLAAHRNPESYVAGNTLLNRDRPRLSEDIGIFHDREERVAQAAEDDTATLQAEGFDIIWMRREPAIFTAEVREGNEHTKS
jgi:hypothetical protein